MDIMVDEGETRDSHSYFSTKYIYILRIKSKKKVIQFKGLKNRNNKKLGHLEELAPPWSFVFMYVSLLLQWCSTLCDAMDWSPPGSSVHGILQTRILEWVVLPSSRGSSQPRDWTHVCLYLLPCKWILYPLRHLGSPKFCITQYKMLWRFGMGFLLFWILILIYKVKNWIACKCKLLQSSIPRRDETERKVVLCQRRERETIGRLRAFGIP